MAQPSRHRAPYLSVSGRSHGRQAGFDTLTLGGRGSLEVDGFGVRNLLNPSTAFLSLSQSPSRHRRYS